MWLDPCEEAAALQAGPQQESSLPALRRFQPAASPQVAPAQRVAKRCPSFELSDPDLDPNPESVPELKLEADPDPVSAHLCLHYRGAEQTWQRTAMTSSLRQPSAPAASWPPELHTQLRERALKPLLRAPAQWDAPFLLGSRQRLHRLRLANVFLPRASVTQPIRVLISWTPSNNGVQVTTSILQMGEVGRRHLKSRHCS